MTKSQESQRIGATMDRMAKRGGANPDDPLNQKASALTASFESTSPSVRTTNEDRQVAAIVVKTMIDRFGYRWTRQHGTTPSDTLARDLRSITPAQLQHGLDDLRDVEREWPPSLPEFYAICRRGTAADAARMPISTTFGQLPEPEEAKHKRRTTALMWLARAREGWRDEELVKDIKK